MTENEASKFYRRSRYPSPLRQKRNPSEAPPSGARRDKELGVEDYKKKMVLVICWAGSDRSRLIGEELEQRGYIVSRRGLMPGQNFVTPEDFENIGAVVFADQILKKRFIENNNIKLCRALKKSRARVSIMNITETEKERAIQLGNFEGLKLRISAELDYLGFKDIKEEI